MSKRITTKMIEEQLRLIEQLEEFEQDHRWDHADDTSTALKQMLISTVVTIITLGAVTILGMVI